MNEGLHLQLGTQVFGQWHNFQVKRDGIILSLKFILPILFIFYSRQCHLKKKQEKPTENVPNCMCRV